MEHSPGLPQDTKSLRSCLRNHAKMLLKGQLGIKCHFQYNNITRLLWHTLHGITLIATPKNGNNYHLLFAQPSSCRSHATSCVSSSLCSSRNFYASTKSTRCNSHQLRGSAFLHMASHPKILPQVFMPELDF